MFNSRALCIPDALPATTGAAAAAEAAPPPPRRGGCRRTICYRRAACRCALCLQSERRRLGGLAALPPAPPRARPGLCACILYTHTCTIHTHIHTYRDTEIYPCEITCTTSPGTPCERTDIQCTHTDKRTDTHTQTHRHTDTHTLQAHLVKRTDIGCTHTHIHTYTHTHTHTHYRHTL